MAAIPPPPSDGGDGRATEPPPPAEVLRREPTFSKEELSALAAADIAGLRPNKPPARLAAVFHPSRRLGLAEKALLKALLKPGPLEELQTSPALLDALGITALPSPTVLAALFPPRSHAAAGRAGSTGQPGAQTGPGFPSPPTGAVPSKGSVPPNEWPAPSPDGVQRMLNSYFQELDGHCRGSLLSLPPQHALAILWDMDAKGATEVRDPQAFIFNAAQALRQMAPVGLSVAVNVLPQGAAAPSFTVGPGMGQVAPQIPVPPQLGQVGGMPVPPGAFGMR